MSRDRSGRAESRNAGDACVTVRLFALARQRAGRPEVALDLPEPATVADLEARARRPLPELAPLVPSLMIAVDADYADDDTADPARRARSRRSRRSAAAELSEHSPRTEPMIEITEAPIDHAALTERVRSNLAGAVCTFLGTVREMTGDRRTASLDYEAYPEMALEEDGRARGRGPPPLADHRGRARPPRRPPRPRRGQRRRRRELPAPRPGVRGLPMADRHAQGSRPDLEEGSLGRRDRGVGPSRPEPPA